jgi:hypothetical protein
MYIYVCVTLSPQRTDKIPLVIRHATNHYENIFIASTTALSLAFALAFPDALRKRAEWSALASAIVTLKAASSLGGTRKKKV